MKTLKITTFWTPDEADCVYEFLGELKAAIWQVYGQEIEQLYEARRQEQMAGGQRDDFDDELLF